MVSNFTALISGCFWRRMSFNYGGNLEQTYHSWICSAEQNLRRLFWIFCLNRGLGGILWRSGGGG